mmetsp:Transcript_21996/g.21714  ORF Transcript_21996/g.21714 Transcript_21996/m.21714 type:complete len:256 (-) Transcript_21996:298-1065(-)
MEQEFISHIPKHKEPNNKIYQMRKKKSLKKDSKQVFDHTCGDSSSLKITRPAFGTFIKRSLNSGVSENKMSSSQTSRYEWSETTKGATGEVIPNENLPKRFPTVEEDKNDNSSELYGELIPTHQASNNESQISGQLSSLEAKLAEFRVDSMKSQQELRNLMLKNHYTTSKRISVLENKIDKLDSKVGQSFARHQSQNPSSEVPARSGTTESSEQSSSQNNAIEESKSQMQDYEPLQDNDDLSDCMEARPSRLRPS